MRALVTGGGRGIGAGIARALAGDGWDVVVAARTSGQVEAVGDQAQTMTHALDASHKRP
jgi:NAD(P)-dependent dehydrogenase (short-subunit alcohol dehydrogenase family)